jgi:hypothetical protein
MVHFANNDSAPVSQVAMKSVPATKQLLMKKPALNSAPIMPPPLSRPLRVTLISRRPYNKFVQHSFVGRQIVNEADILHSARRLPGLIVDLYDFVNYTFVEQLKILSCTDILVGMHGAALTGQLFMPPHAGVLELWSTEQMWRCFEQLAALMNRPYFRWSNLNKGMFSTDSKGDYTIIDVNQFMSELVKTVIEVRARMVLLKVNAHDLVSYHELTAHA